MEPIDISEKEWNQIEYYSLVWWALKIIAKLSILALAAQHIFVCGKV